MSSTPGADAPTPTPIETGPASEATANAVVVLDPAVITDPKAVAPAAPETIWYKGKRVIRTILAALIVVVPVANGLLPALAQAFNSPDVPASVYIAVNGVIVAALAVLGVITRIMAIPAVNGWLTKLGAGSVPASAIRS